MVDSMNLCDLHCDTAFELHARGEHLSSGSLNIDLEKINTFEKYVQLSAVCAAKDDSDSDAFDRFFAVLGYFTEEVKRCSCRICSSPGDILSAVRDNIPAFIMTVEDARLLAGKIGRLNLLFDAGVRVITPLWGGESIIGGSHESEAGLTPFGRDVAKGCAELGIITDISHASLRSSDELIDIAVAHGMPVIASHSCAYDVSPHSRNLRREHLTAVVASGGIVGVNLYPPHLNGGDSECSDVGDVVKHIKYYLDETGEASVALGCDFDGMGSRGTRGLEDVSKLPSLYSALLGAGVSESTAERIFFSNALAFLTENLAS